MQRLIVVFMAFKTTLAVWQALLSLSSASLLIPRPAGPYGTNVSVAALTDYGHLDPFAPKPENRSMVVSVYYPVAPVDQCQWTVVPAYPAKTAAIFNEEVSFAGVPNGTFERIRIEYCIGIEQSYANAQLFNLANAPYVFFSTGLGLSRLWYSALSQAVASFGFTVVTVDTPYDADVVEFPNGQTIRAINSTWDPAQSLLDVQVRSENIAFILNELSKSTFTDTLFPVQKSRPNASRAGVFGHSIGGATAALAMYMDDRLIGGINYDGGLYGPVIQEGLENPFMLFGHKSNSTSHTVVEIWPHLNWKLNIEILNSTHTTFTDIPLLADLIFGLPLPPFVEGIVGQIPGPRARSIISTYTAAFFNLTLKCQSTGFLQRPSPSFPEIEFDPGPR